MAKNLADLRERVNAYAYVHGKQFAATDAATNGVINEGLRGFTRETLCLYSPQVVFNLTASINTYNLEGSTNPVVSGATSEFARIDNIILNDGPLADFDGEIGPCDWERFRAQYPSYPSATAGTPNCWMYSSPRSIYLYPAASSAFVTSSSGKNFFSGFRLHTTLSTDGTELEIPDDYLDVAAAYIACKLVAPYAAGESWAQLMQMDAKNSKMMQEITNEARRKLVRPGPRSGAFYLHEDVWF